MKYILSLLYLALTVLYLQAQSITQTMLRLPDTGQNTSYTTTFGEDNDFTFNAPFFTDNNDGTITDTVTGLMWQKTDGGEMTIESARAYSDTLALAGYSNWRLPNPHEAFSILNHQNANPALDVSIFTNTGAEYWWTSVRQSNDSTKVWATNAGGGVGNHPKAETLSAGGNKKFHVRSVRDVFIPATISAHFTDNGDGTITDHLTNLIWQNTALPDSLDWEQALTYADTLEINGYTNWRLPNIKELQSINDESRINPSVNTAFFPQLTTGKYWSSTTLPNQTTKAWYLDTRFGITTYDVKNTKHTLLCVCNKKTTTTGISETYSPPFAVYPNPFNAFIHITPNSGKAQCELLNYMGQIVYSGTDLEKQDFSSLAGGIYFLKLQSQPVVAFKLIKL